MSGTDFPDPRTVPSMLEAGVSGIARDRAWDLVVSVEAPELRGSPLSRVSFHLFAPGEAELVGVEGEDTVSDEILALFASHAAESMAPPLEARAVRTTDTVWSLAMRRASRRPSDVELPEGVWAVSVARAPDGELTAHVNGELMVEPSGPVAEAIDSIVAVAEQEEDAFVATLEQFESGRVVLSIDAL